MDWITGAAVYVIIWWVVLFMVLPWGVRPVEAEDVARGHASSAPQRPRMLLKVAVTSLAAGVVWFGVYYIIEAGLISFRT